ncbi:MAG: hypothetical protein ACXVYY_02890 [Oryzihumus sp.]
MADKKVVFVAFAIEDERQRDFLKGQSLSPRAPYEFIDMSVKEAYESDWKDKVRTRHDLLGVRRACLSAGEAASPGPIG